MFYCARARIAAGPVKDTQPVDRHKACPFCAEEIKAAAIVCRYCGRDLPEIPKDELVTDN